ncbi:MAG: Na/Pi cotransporter family protein [Gammaproteobacteria bacterium]|nr:Na/Pi cotransporter family protein [Gammaproteobacteria bacterium]
MLRNILLPSIFISLGFGFWVSPDFKTISAGVAIFLFGMLSLESGFKVFTGGTLEKILSKATNNRWKSIGFGVVSTSVMQSSSLVSVITISFLSAGLIGLYQGIGIIFGANLGTTTGAWLIAGFGLKVNISAYAMPMLVFGTLLIFQSSKSLKGIGYILAGLGFLFLGIHYMKEGFEAFKDTLDLTQFSVGGLKGLLLYTLIGISATVVMQSSHATLVLTITALSSGQISYENALALAIGANVGTTITAIIGALSSNEQGKRLAAAHLIFNLVTGLVAIAFLSQILSLVNVISDFTGINAEDYTLKLAVFHTIFNLLGIIIMLPLMNMMVEYLERMFKPQTQSRLKPRFLHESTIAYPDTATQAVRNETLHMWDNTIDIIAHGLRLPRSELLNEKSNLDKIVLDLPVKDSFDIDRYYELKIKSLYSEIIAYISRASFSWELEQSGEIHWLRKANQDMVDAIKDVKHMQKNLAKYTVSNNQVIKEQYNGLRIQIAQLVQSLESIRTAESSDIPSLMIDQLKLESDTQYTLHNKNINEMIRKRVITADMAISLMNDRAYVYNISRKLIDMGETLFIKQNKGISKAEKTLQLDDNELKDIHDQHQSKT